MIRSQHIDTAPEPVIVRLLLVEGDPAYVEEIRLILRDTESTHFEITHCALLAEARACLQQDGFDVVLLDLRLPDSEGLNLFMSLGALVSQTPIVVLTSREDETLALQLLQAGAQDYLIKGEAKQYLSRALRYALERQRAAQNAHKSEQFFSTIFHASPVGITMSRLEDSTILEANEAFLSFVGYRRDEVIGRTGLELGLWAEPAEHARLVETLREHGQAHNVALLLRARDGSIRHMLYSSEQLRFDGVRYILSYFQDTTRRRRAEERLHRSTQQLRDTLESITDAFFALDLEWRFTYLNAQASIVLQRQRADLLGRSVWDEFPEAVGSPFYTHYHEAVATKKSVTFEAWYEPLRTWFEVHAYPLPDGLAVYFRDVTERRNANMVLRERESALNAIFEGTLDALLIVNDLGECVSVNEAASTLVGLPREAITGRSLLDFAAPEKRDGGHVPWQRLLEEGTQIGDFLLLRPDGERRDVEFTSRANISQGRHLFVLRDVTVRKEAERAVRDAKERAIVEYRLLLDRIDEMARDLGSAVNLVAVCRVLLRFVRASAPCDAILVTLNDTGHQRRHCIYAWGGGKEVDASRLASLSITDSQHSYDNSDGEIIVTDDLQAAPGDLPRVHAGVEIDSSLPRSSIVVPMKVFGRVIGTFEVQSTEPASYTDEHVTALKLSANLAANSIYSLQRLEREHDLRLLAEALSETSAALNSTLDFEEILDLILDKVEQVVPHQASSFLLVTPAEMRLLRSRGFDEEARKQLMDWVLPVAARPRYQRMLDEGMGFFRNTSDDPTWIPTAVTNWIQSTISVPVRIRGLGAGVLNLDSNQPDFFDAGDLARLQVFADQAGAALENARLLSTTQRRAAELAVIAEISAALRGAATRDEMLALVLEQIMAHWSAEAAAFDLHDPVTEEMVLALGSGRWAGNSGLRLPKNEGLSPFVMATGEVYYNNDIVNESRVTYPALLQEITAIAIAPLTSEGLTMGALWVGRKQEIEPDDASLLASIANIVASALRRVTLFEQTARSARRLTAMHKIDSAITSSVDRRLAIDIVLEQATSQLGLDAAAVLLLNRHSLTLEHVANRGFYTRAITRSSLRLGQGAAGRAALEGRTITILDLGVEADFARRGLLASEGFASYIAVPLVAKGQVEGVLELFHRSRIRLESDWLDFLNVLAGQAAIAVDNARLFEDLQRSNLELGLAYDATIEGWSRALDLRDRETEGHSQRVTDLTLELARTMGVDNESLRYVRWGALLHDIGKMGVPDGILLKAGPLNDEEWAVMKLHPTFAHNLLAPIEFLRPALDIPYCHHEKWDGTGYPRGLEGDGIPLTARIFAVVDMWDALRADRPYRSAWTEKEALDYIRQQVGSHLDPTVVEHFLRLVSPSDPS